MTYIGQKMSVRACEAYGIIKGKWVYLEDCKKSLSGKYVRVVKKFDRSPRGTAQIFKNIEKGLRK